MKTPASPIAVLILCILFALFLLYCGIWGDIYRGTSETPQTNLRHWGQPTSCPLNSLSLWNRTPWQERSLACHGSWNFLRARERSSSLTAVTIWFQCPGHSLALVHKAHCLKSPSFSLTNTPMKNLQWSFTDGEPRHKESQAQGRKSVIFAWAEQRARLL